MALTNCPECGQDVSAPDLGGEQYINDLKEAHNDLKEATAVMGQLIDAFNAAHKQTEAEKERRLKEMMTVRERLMSWLHDDVDRLKVRFGNKNLKSTCQGCGKQFEWEYNI